VLKKAGSVADASTRGGRPEDVPNLVPQLLQNQSQSVVQNQTVTVAPTQNQSTNVDVHIGAKVEPYEYKLKSSAAGFALSLLTPGVGHFYYGSNNFGWIYVASTIGGYLASVAIIDGLDIANGDLEAGLFVGVFVHGGIGLIAGIHAAIGVSGYNNRIIEEYQRSKQTGFRGVTYLPIRTAAGTTTHGAGLSWGF
jgi:hypothetical protein